MSFNKFYLTLSFQRELLDRFQDDGSVLLSMSRAQGSSKLQQTGYGTLVNERFLKPVNVRGFLKSENKR